MTLHLRAYEIKEENFLNLKPLDTLNTKRNRRIKVVEPLKKYQRMDDNTITIDNKGRSVISPQNPTVQ